MQVCTVDKDELVKLLCENYPYVVRLMKIIGVDENDIEDLAEDVFIDAFNGLSTLRDPDKMVPWLRTIAGNRASKYFAKRSRRREISNMVKTEAGEIDIFDMVADEVTVESILRDAEERDLVNCLINTLPDVSRRIIRMRFWADYKHAEIAEVLGINLNTEKSIYRRSLKLLKDNYAGIFGKDETHE